MCTVSHKDAVNQYFVHTEGITSFDPECLRDKEINALRKNMSNLVAELRSVQPENTDKINEIQAKIAEIDAKLRSLCRHGAAVRQV